MGGGVPEKIDTAPRFKSKDIAFADSGEEFLRYREDYWRHAGRFLLGADNGRLKRSRRTAIGSADEDGILFFPGWNGGIQSGAQDHGAFQSVWFSLGGFHDDLASRTGPISHDQKTSIVCSSDSSSFLNR